MTEIPLSKKHNSTFSFVTRRQEQTHHRSGTKACRRQGCVWLTQGLVQVKITEPRAVNEQHWSSSVSLVPLRSGIGSWLVPGLLLHLGRDMGTMPSALQLLTLSPNRRWSKGWWQSWWCTGIITFTGKYIAKMHLKPGLNWLCCPCELPRETAGTWDSKKSLQGPGAIPNGCRVLCIHITIIINLNVHHPVILTSSICSLDCFFFCRFLHGDSMTKTKPHSSQPRHEKLQGLNISPPAPQIIQFWEPTATFHRSCGCPHSADTETPTVTVFRLQSQYSTLHVIAAGNWWGTTPCESSHGWQAFKKEPFNNQAPWHNHIFPCKGDKRAGVGFSWGEEPCCRAGGVKSSAHPPSPT